MELHTQPHCSLPLNQASLSSQSSFCPASTPLSSRLVGATLSAFNSLSWQVLRIISSVWMKVVLLCEKHLRNAVTIFTHTHIHTHLASQEWVECTCFSQNWGSLFGVHLRLNNRKQAFRHVLSCERQWLFYTRVERKLKILLKAFEQCM